MKAKFLFTFSFVLAFCGAITAQFWMDDIYKGTDNYYDIKARFDKHWETHDKTVKGSGYKPFMRWAAYAEPRVYPSGDLSLLNLTPKNYAEFLKQYRSSSNERNSMTASITWTAMGPMGSQPGPMPSAVPPVMKSGRVNFITINPTNTLNLWAGTPSGGLWKSIDGGANWTTNTDQMPTLGSAGLVIDPTNTNIMYLATGDGQGFAAPSIGILKSIDGGLTWNPTGFTAPAASVLFAMKKLIINPQNPQILIASCNTGLHRTTDGGVTWTQVASFWAHDVEFNAANPNIVYASGLSGGAVGAYISNNGGVSFNLMSNNGVPVGGGRLLVAVTPADPAYVYLLSTTQSGNYMGLYRSTDSGATFSLMSTSPNIVLGNGSYNLALDVSPLDKNEVVGGGINLHKSTNGGSTWTMFANSFGPNSIHCDVHYVKYAPNGRIYATTDGGIWTCPPNSGTWTEISGAMNISQIYRMGASALTPGKWISGHQDNGSNIRTSAASYTGTWVGDGMECFYDRTNDNNVFCSYQGASMYRSTNGGLTWTATAQGLGPAIWVNPWKQDPVSPNVIYASLNTLYKSTDLGVTWAPVGFGSAVVDFAIAPSNNQVIYALSGWVRRTTDGGATWSVPLTNGLPASIQETAICIDPLNPNKAWFTCSGYQAGDKVFMTTNGGVSWTNVSGNLPNIPANCIIYEPNSPDRVYVGMDVGVYYMDNTTNGNWVLYNNGLPNAPLKEFEISPATPNILYAVTFGRGIYAVSLIGSPTPVANFNSSATGTNCAGVPITFSDQSTNTPNAWSWSVTPANGANISLASAQNPNITFLSAGIYTVSLQATNANGQGIAVSQTINITPAPVLAVSGSVQTVCTGEAVSYTAIGASSYTWSNGGGTASSATYVPTGTTQYTVTGSSNGCTSAKVVSVTVSICTGISSVMLQDQAYSVFPNPSKGRLTLKTSGDGTRPVHLHISDASGKVVFEQDIHFNNKQQTEINIEQLAHGTYFITLSAGQEGSRPLRIIKE
jgi:PKD repeat protein